MLFDPCQLVWPVKEFCERGGVMTHFPEETWIAHGKGMGTAITFAFPSSHASSFPSFSFLLNQRQQPRMTEPFWERKMWEPSWLIRLKNARTKVYP
jgi:hypothetical protein